MDKLYPTVTTAQHVQPSHMMQPLYVTLSRDLKVPPPNAIIPPLIFKVPPPDVTVPPPDFGEPIKNHMVPKLHFTESPPFIATPVPHNTVIPFQSNPQSRFLTMLPGEVLQPPQIFTGTVPEFTLTSRNCTVPAPDFTVPPPVFSGPPPNFTVPPPFWTASATPPLSHSNPTSFCRTSPYSSSHINQVSEQGTWATSLTNSEERNLANPNNIFSQVHSADRHVDNEQEEGSLSGRNNEEQHRQVRYPSRSRKDSRGDRSERSGKKTDSTYFHHSIDIESHRSHHRSYEVDDPIVQSRRGRRNDVTGHADRFPLHAGNVKKEVIEDTSRNPSQPTWYRSSPADLYYTPSALGLADGTAELEKLCTTFRDTLLTRPPPATDSPPRRDAMPLLSSADSSSEGEDRSEEEARMRWLVARAADELRHKQAHPRRLHPDLWHNEPGQLNAGAECRCSAQARREGVHHGKFPAEPHASPCHPNRNNLDQLHHYSVTVSPPTNFLSRDPTVIIHDGHEFIFSGFSMFSHYKLENVPSCKLIRYKIEYTIYCEEESAPVNFTIQELKLFQDYLFLELLELVDFVDRDDTQCRYHFMPKFIRSVDGGGTEILAMSEVLKYLLNSYKPLMVQDDGSVRHMDDSSWDHFLHQIKGSIVRNPDKKPSSLRLDHVDRPVPSAVDAPHIVHFSSRPKRLCYLADIQYQKTWQECAKYRAAIARMEVPSALAKRRLREAEARLYALRQREGLRREVTATVSSQGFYATGIRTDVVQHAMLVPLLVKHLRLHASLPALEARLGYRFRQRDLLQAALTHPSYYDRHGTNADHARNALANCGLRRVTFGRMAIPHASDRGRGIKKQMWRMLDFGTEEDNLSTDRHNERLEYLGDAVLYFLTSLHLYMMFPEHSEGMLSIYRVALVQNNYLAVLGQHLELQKYMLAAHGPDLCQAAGMRHAVANCFEAVVGAVYLDGGVGAADSVVATVLWRDAPTSLATWSRRRQHPLCAQEPLGDRAYVTHFKQLQRLTQLEESIGVTFRHIRLLAQALTVRSAGYTHLTLGSNQRMEYLGDALLQLRATDHLYRHFPRHQEGHLSLLRTSLVNNSTLATISDELGLPAYIISSLPASQDVSPKQKADLVEAFLAALYLDKGMDYVDGVLKVCLYSKLPDVIADGGWNNPKSQLQQILHSLRPVDETKNDVPRYRTVEVQGPSNFRQFSVVVFFGGQRLSVGTGPTKIQAEMAAAESAITKWNNCDPRLLQILKPDSENKYSGNKSDSSSSTSSSSSDDRENCGSVSDQ